MNNNVFVEYRLFVDQNENEYRIDVITYDAIYAELTYMTCLRGMAQKYNVPIAVVTHMWNAYRHKHNIPAKLV